MSYIAIDSVDVVQVHSPTLVTDALLVTFQSFPSGSVLILTVPQNAFEGGGGPGLLRDLSDAVEGLIQGGLATAAQGVQGIDPSGLIFDAVDFTVTYVPPTPTAGTLTAQVQVPVGVITLDTAIAAAYPGGNATERLQATYDRLAQLASG